MADSESEERLQRAASLRRTVAETIARVRRATAHIGVPHPPSDADSEPTAVAPAPEIEPEFPPEPNPSAESGEARGDGGLGHDVSALLERTRSVIERTRRVIEESKASLTHPRHPDLADESDDPDDPDDGEKA